MDVKLADGEGAGGDGDDAGTDRPRTTDVEGRVADDPDFALGQMQTAMLASGGEGFAGDVVALVMGVAKTAEVKMLGEGVVRKFLPRSFADVAGEEAELHPLARLKLLH